MGNATPPDEHEIRRARRRRNIRRSLTAAVVLIAGVLGEQYVHPATARDPKPKASQSQFATAGNVDGTHGNGKWRWPSWTMLLGGARAHGHHLPDPPSWWGHDKDKPHGAAGAGHKAKDDGSGSVPGGGSDGLSALVGGGPDRSSDGSGGDGSAGADNGPGGVGAPNALAGFPNGGSGGPGGGGPNAGNGGNGGPGNNDKSPLLLTTTDLPTGAPHATVPEPGVTILVLGSLGILVASRQVKRVDLSPSPLLRSGRGRGSAAGR